MRGEQLTISKDLYTNVSLMNHMVQNRDNIEFEIILILLRGKFHLREIARTLKQPHATIFRRLLDLKKGNIVDFNQEGKNKVYFIKDNFMAKQFVYSAENYKLVKIINKYPELTIIFDEILKKVKEEIIILFGSYAKFTANEESDIDIYAESQDRSIVKKLGNINSKINGKVGSFDPDSLLIKEIIKNHVILRGVEKFYDKSKFFE